MLALRSLSLLFLAAFSGGAADSAFDSSVRPIFAAKCNSCHGAQPQGQLDLRTEAAALRGGHTGPAIQPGESDRSLLLDKIVTRQMPPGPLPKLSAAEIDRIRQWIDSLPKPTPTTAAQEHEVLAILQARCMICHGSLKQEGGLDLRTVASRLKGGKSGPALVPGDPAKSPMYQRLIDGTMPPAKLAKQLAVELPTDTELEKIRSWIAAGARPTESTPTPAFAALKPQDRNFWSFTAPKPVAVPPGAAHPIDAFILAKLKSKGLSFAPEADPLTLLRRVTFDLTGLPPSPADIDAFLNDRAPGAYERVVDRLLASQHYGERWGQHWLDLAGYSDSEGFGQDDGVRPYAWRYRDYVIRSLNADKPYDQFLTEQLAGDELAADWKNTRHASPAVVDRLAATGFLRCTPDQTNSNERALIAERMNVVADEVEVLASSVMGLTMTCARCHDHKYDPIPQRDYYRLSAILQAAYNPYEWKAPRDRELPLATPEELERYEKDIAPLQAESKRLQAQIDALAEKFRPEGDQSNVRQLERKFPELAAQIKPIREELDKVRRQIKPAPHIRILTDNAEPSRSYLLRRGDPVGFGDPVEPGVPSVLSTTQPYTPQSPFPGASGRRLALARWLTQPRHPLTARVAVNQIWSRHFGRGIVPSVSNFGRSGLPPTHPELLDWLALEFENQGWSMKKLHRLIVTSRTYRQTSAIDSARRAADPDNALFSRMLLQRLDGETLYDAMISAAGRLDPRPFGEPQPIEVKPDKEVVVKASSTGYRRAIYVLHRRQTPVSLLDSFDQPPMTPNCPERRRSNVATQALHMMNGTITWDLARFMAGRIIDEAPADLNRQIDLVYRRAYSRPASADESAAARDAISSFARQWPERLERDRSEAPRAATAHWLALANFCHAILNSAEFSYLD